MCLNLKLQEWLTKLKVSFVEVFFAEVNCGHLINTALNHFSKSNHGEEVLEEDGEGYSNNNRQGERHYRTKRSGHVRSKGG